MMCRLAALRAPIAERWGVNQEARASSIANALLANGRLMRIDAARRTTGLSATQSRRELDALADAGLVNRVGSHLRYQVGWPSSW